MRNICYARALIVKHEFPNTLQTIDFFFISRKRGEVGAARTLWCVGTDRFVFRRLVAASTAAWSDCHFRKPHQVSAKGEVRTLLVCRVWRPPCWHIHGVNLFAGVFRGKAPLVLLT